MEELWDSSISYIGSIYDYWCADDHSSSEYYDQEAEISEDDNVFFLLVMGEEGYVLELVR